MEQLIAHPSSPSLLPRAAAARYAPSQLQDPFLSPLRPLALGMPAAAAAQRMSALHLCCPAVPIVISLSGRRLQQAGAGWSGLELERAARCRLVQLTAASGVVEWPACRVRAGKKKYSDILVI